MKESLNDKFPAVIWSKRGKYYIDEKFDNIYKAKKHFNDYKYVNWRSSIGFIRSRKINNKMVFAVYYAGI